jgi:hypothetical protein
MIRHFLADCRQLEMFLLDERVFACFGKLSVMGCLVPQVVIPIRGRLPSLLVVAAPLLPAYPAAALAAIGL